MMKKKRSQFAVACMALYGLLHGVGVHATDVATRPINAGGLVKPNVILGWDNTTSMNWELIANTKQGMLWWDTEKQAAWDASGKPVAYVSESRGISVGYGVLFPILGGDATKGENWWPLTGTYGAALPPTKQFAAMWSSAYNPMYYDPDVTYTPWAPANMDGASNTRTLFTQEDPTSARSHPGLAGTVRRNLTVEQNPWATNSGYNMQPGMIVPAGSTDTSGKTYTTETTLTKALKVRIPHYWPTYWQLVAAKDCPVAANNPTCAHAPGSTTMTLKRVQIAPGTPEMKNFANWWSYYRSRLLMGAAATGKALEHLSGVRLGVSRFNPTNTVTMYDTDAADDALNARRAAGFVYSSPMDSGTRTLDTLVHIGEEFRNNRSVIEYACQRNNAFIVTDGYADRSPTRVPPAYSASRFGSGWPYQTTHGNTIANVALSYFTSRDGDVQMMRADLTTGRVPLGDQTKRNPDSNRNLHMNTYAVTLGVKGKIWPATPDAFSVAKDAFAWPVPATDTPDTIDDLWHATINGRGLMFETSNAFETAARFVESLEDMTQAAGGQAAVAVTTSDLAAGDGFIYRATYDAKGWSGDVKAQEINKATAAVSSTVTWSAADKLAARKWDERVIATSNGSAGLAFTTASVGASAAVVEYLRGKRDGEGTLYRKREKLLGAVLNARPVVADGVVYASTGEGMLHAFDAVDGEELWAYAPYSALPGLRTSASRTWAFKNLLDGSPTLVKVGATQLLIVGRGVAGNGYAALDVTDAKTIKSADALATRVKWEFPSKQGITTAGLAVGKPVFVSTRNDGDVVLLTQGYNGSNDGIGRVYMLDALTGALKHTFLADTKSGSGDPGLAHVSAMMERDGKAAYAYAGDERGNLWRLDLDNKTVTRIAQLKNGTGVAQPVTAPPELVFVGGQRVVLVGTGRLLGLADLSDAPPTQSFYAIKDAGGELTNARSALVARTLSTEEAGKRDLSGSAFSWESNRGWYFDLPAGQQANTSPAVVHGAVVFMANAMTRADCAGASYLYVADIKSGLNVAPPDVSYAAIRLGDQTSSTGAVVATDTGEIRVVSQKSGTVVVSVDEIDLPAAGALRKNAWRQIHRR